MVTILGIVFCVLAVVGIVLLLFMSLEHVKERKERQQYAVELLESLQLKVFLLKTDLGDFAERNNLMQSDFFYRFSFLDCIASVTSIEAKCTDPALIDALKSSKREKQVSAVLADCKSWMLHIDRVSSSLETKRRNPVYNKELLVAV